MTNSIINTNNKRISEIDNFLGKNQSASISTADIFLKRIFVIKINWKNVNKKNGRTQFVKKCVLTKNPNKHFFRGQFFNLNRSYRARCQQKKRKFERKLLQNLENLYSYNDKEVWNLFKQIKGNSSNKLLKYQTLTPLK